MTESRTSLADTDTVLRIFDNKYRRADGTIRLDAFKIRDNGKDADGLSVTRKGGRTIGTIEQSLDLKNQGKQLCYLQPVEIRKISATSEIDLDVVSAPTANDLLHALIVGKAVFSFDKALKRRVAELLSSLAICCNESLPQTANE